MISAAQLASMQATMALTRTDEAEVQRYTEIIDEAGGVKPDWVTVLTVPARVGPQGMSSWEQIDKTEGKVVSTSVWWIGLPPGTDVQPEDRLAIGERTFEVINQRGPRTIEIERLVQCAEVK